MDKKRIENAVREILIAIGENPEREGLIETPERKQICMRKFSADLKIIPKN